MHLRLKQLLFATIILITLFSCNSNPKPTELNEQKIFSKVPDISYSVPRFFPHDTTLFTEGFLFYKGELFESTGSPDDLPQTESLIGVDNLATGKFSKKIELDKTKYFGEGITFLDNKLFQLTYKSQVGFIYDVKSFKKIGQFKYDNKEGWSLTTDGKDLILSDGTSNLTFLNPINLKPVKTLSVTLNGSPQDSLNELEYIKGFIYANVWMNNSIYKINPATGQVVGRLDLSLLTQDARNKNPRADVLNGIAYDSASDKIYVTGKMWANIYQINFNH
jgi:glutaminyl-peptide cyclotransferase